MSGVWGLRKDTGEKDFERAKGGCGGRRAGRAGRAGRARRSRETGRKTKEGDKLGGRKTTRKEGAESCLCAKRDGGEWRRGWCDARCGRGWNELTGAREKKGRRTSPVMDRRASGGTKLQPVVGVGDEGGVGRG